MTVDPRFALMASARKAVTKADRNAFTGSAEDLLEFPNVFASSGSLALDRLISGFNPGGAPYTIKDSTKQGRIIHVAGEWSTGKSLLLDHWFRSVIVDLKGIGKRAETEGSADPHFANAIGLPLDLLDVDRPDTFEQMTDMFMEWHDDIRKQDEEIPVIYGVDSLDSTESEKSAGKGLQESGGWHYGGGASEVLGVMLKRMARVCSRYPTTVVLLNQTRDNVGVMFGPKKRTSKGNPPHFYASMEIMLSGSPRPGKGFVRSDVELPDLSAETKKRLGIFDMDKAAPVIGRYIRALCTKTKMSNTLESYADFYIDFRKGVHKWECLAERLMMEGVLKSNGDMSELSHVDPRTGEVMSFVNAEKTAKQQWLNWVVANMDVLGLQIEKAEEQTTAEAQEAPKKRKAAKKEKAAE